MEIEVAKLGGSLLSRDDFVPAVRAWLGDWQSDHADGHLVLVIGGGPLVDVLRRFDALHPLPDVVCHWQAIELMQVTGRLVSGWLPELTVAESLAELRERCLRPGVTLMLLTHFLRAEEPRLPGRRLPEGWHVTSDSIAARLAVCLAAARLRLIKSIPLDAAELADSRHLSQQGRIDAFFPHLVDELGEITWETLPCGPVSQEGASVCVN